jgi:cytoskeletal protein RodZ
MPLNDSKSDRSPPWEPESEGESVGFGLWLQRQRELREIPLREIADVTKISLRYLEALESDRFDVLPAPVFVKGFLRQYSRYVGLDADEVVNSFLIATGEIEDPDREEDTVQSRKESRARDRTRLSVVLAVVAIVVIIIAIAAVSRLRREEPAPTSTLAAPVPEVAAPDISPAIASGGADATSMPLTVTIDFTDDCWVEAVVDGERSTAEMRVQGESISLPARERILLKLGNSAAARVEVNGVPFDFSRSPGQQVANLEIDLALAEALGGNAAPLADEGAEADDGGLPDPDSGDEVIDGGGGSQSPVGEES